jgi:Flp pilus assembly protein TadD
LSWQAIVIGDPLCAPFQRERLTSAQIDPGLDPQTELPPHFSRRRLAILQKIWKDVTPEVLPLMLRAEARLAREDVAGARETLEQITSASPTLVGARLELAMLEEREGNRDAAAAHYRRILELDANHVVALNNLAYTLGVHRDALDEGLALARKAAALAPKSVVVIDTLAWLEHLAGNSGTAASLFREALQSTDATGEVHLHAAIVFAEVSDVAAAAAQLQKALAADPTLETHPDIARLRERLKTGH